MLHVFWVTWSWISYWLHGDDTLRVCKDQSIGILLLPPIIHRRLCIWEEKKNCTQIKQEILMTDWQKNVVLPHSQSTCTSPVFLPLPAGRLPATEPSCLILIRKVTWRPVPGYLLGICIEWQAKHRSYIFELGGIARSWKKHSSACIIVQQSFFIIYFTWTAVRIARIKKQRQVKQTRTLAYVCACICV